MKNIQNIQRLGVDLAKNCIQVYAVDSEGEAVMNRRFSRTKVLEFFQKLNPPCIIGLEACGGTHNWGRILEGLGHQVRMMPAQYVQPFVKTNKNDAADAFICVMVLMLQTLLYRRLVSHGQAISARQMLDELAAIKEVGVVYPCGRKQSTPKIQMTLSGMSDIQKELYKMLQLERYRTG